MTTPFTSSLPAELLERMKTKEHFGWLQSWIQEGISEEGIQSVAKFATHLGQMDLTKTAMRNFFNEVKGMQLKGYDPTQFLLLRAKLVYALGKNESKEGSLGKGFSQFLTLLLVAHEMVEKGNQDHFDRYVNLLETLLAYHKLAAAEKNQQPKENKSQPKNKDHHGKYNKPNRR